MRLPKLTIGMVLIFVLFSNIIINQTSTQAETDPELILETELRFLFGKGGGKLKITVKGDLAQEIRQDIFDDFYLNKTNPNTVISQTIESKYVEGFEDLLEMNINPARLGKNDSTKDIPPNEANVEFEGKYKMLNVDRVDIKSIDGLLGTKIDDNSKFVIELDVKEMLVEDEQIIFTDAYIILYALWGEKIPSFHVAVKEKCNIVTIGTTSFSNFKLDSGGEITHYRLILGEYIEYHHEYELNGYDLSNDKKDRVTSDSFNILENSLVLLIIIIVLTIVPSIFAGSITKKKRMKKLIHLRLLGIILFISLLIIYFIGFSGLSIIVTAVIFLIINFILLLGIYQKGWGNLALVSFNREDFYKEPPKIESGPWHQRGIQNAKVGNFEEAINCFEMALEAEHENATIWNDLGFVHRKMGNYRVAIDCFNKALEIRPGYQTALDNLEKAELEFGTQRTKITNQKKRKKRKR